MAKLPDSTSRPPSRKNTIARPARKRLENQPDTTPDDRSKPGGHPGHDQSRRLSLPPVVAPEIFETIIRQVFVEVSQGRVRVTFIPASRDHLMGVIL